MKLKFLVKNFKKSSAKKSVLKKTLTSRRHTRKDFSHKIKFETENGIFEGTTKNISISGIFIATKEKFEVGQIIKLNLPTKSGVLVEFNGQIVRVNEEGFGLKYLTD
jgi:hypothetical protein